MTLRTLTEARAYRYGKWAGNPRGRCYAEGDCAYEVFPAGREMHHQCTRLNGYGPAKLYCRQHAKQLSRQTR